MRTQWYHYTDEEKLKLIEAFQASGLCVSHFERKNGLGNSTISKWMTKFGLSKANERKPMAPIEEKSKSIDKRSAQERILEARIKQLEQELRDEKIKSLAYKTMIEIAEEELGVDISKKAGAKQ